VQTITSLQALSARPRAVAIGTFDGVHIGHREVIQTMLQLARQEQLISSVLTFDRHPLALIDPSRQPRMLTPASVKLVLLSEMNPDELIVLPFTWELATQTADEFCRHVLVGALRARVVVVGASFTYGAGAAGTPATLIASGAELGFRTVVVPLATARGKPISSTRIRRLLATGALEEVREILGRPPSTHGSVVVGLRRGRTLGVPTANLQVEAGTIFPGRGVYAARALVDGRWYRAAVNVGHNPTFHSRTEEAVTIHIEAYLLDFNADIYGHEIRVDFLHKIRDEARFDDVASLVAQMQQDIALTAQLDDPAFTEVGLAPSRGGSAPGRR
jgi:riboflavin kinase/FMN adenylyltransferase